MKALVPRPKTWAVRELGDGTAALRVHGEARWLVLTDEELELARAFDGQRTVETVLAEVARTRRRLPYAQLFDVLSKLSAAGFLANPPDELAAAGLPVATAEEEAAARRGVDPGADRAFTLLYRLGGRLLVHPIVIVASAAVLAGTLVRDANGPEQVKLVVPALSMAGSGAMAALLCALVVVLVRSWRGVIGGLAVKSAGREVVGWSFGALGLQVDERDVLLAPRDDRLRVHLTLLASHLGLATMLVPVLEAVGTPHARELARVVFPVSVVSLFVALLPVGDGDLGRLLAEITGIRNLSTQARSYLERKALPRLFGGRDDHADERLFLGLSFATVVWFVLGLAGAGWLARNALRSDASGAMWAVVAAPYAAMVGVALAAAGRNLASGLRAARLRREGPRARAVRPLENPDEVASLLAEVPVFATLADDGERRALAQRLTRQRFGDGDPVVLQGAPGDAFYVVVAGRADVVIESKTGVERTVARLGRGDSFGEIALLERAPRAATVVARGDLEVLALAREDFEGFVGADDTRRGRVRELVRLATFLRNVDAFREAPGPTLGWLIGRLKRLSYPAGAPVMREGEIGDRFYVVEKGEVRVTSDGALLAKLGPGDFFGEVALIRDVPRTATVVADGDVDVLALSRDDFRSFLASHLLGAAFLEETAERRRAEQVA